MHNFIGKATAPFDSFTPLFPAENNETNINGTDKNKKGNYHQMNIFKKVIRDYLSTNQSVCEKGAPESDPLLHPAPGQFHPLAVETEMWDVFALVLERIGDSCQIIPGSMDPLKGGPSDILIPAPGNHDQYWTLNLGLKQELHADAMLPGFASLTPGLLNYVKYGLNKFELGEPLGDKFRFCLPYIGKNDSRRMYRDNLKQILASIA